MFPVSTAKYGVLSVKTHVFQIFFSIISAESNPYICPGVFCVRSVKSLYLGFNQKTVPGFQPVFIFSYPVNSFSLQNVVNQVIRPDRRAKAVAGLASGVTAVAQIYIREFSVC